MVLSIISLNGFVFSFIVMEMGGSRVEKKFLLFQSQIHSVIQVCNKLELGAFGSERSIFLLNPGSTCAGAFTEADQTREGDDYVGGVVQAV